MVFTKEFWENRREEMIKKLSESHKGNKSHLGFKHSEETKRKIREARVKQIMTPKQKMSLANYVKKNGSPMRGKHQTLKAKKRISEALSGEKSLLWRGGISKQKYPNEYKRLRREKKIQKRDDFTCQLCGDYFSNPHKRGDRKFLTIHHIDYNKKNNQENNLISLCNFCNNSANTSREQWTKFFRERLKC
jgi:hypothetical protein